MQIHEIFRRNTNEGILKGVKTLPPRNDRGRFMPVAATGAFGNMATNLTTPKSAPAPAPAAPSKMGSIAKAVGSHIKSAASDYISNKTGLDAEWDNASPYGDQQKAAATAAAPVIKAQAEKQQKLWADGVAKTLQQNNVNDLSQLDSGTKAGLQRSLMNQIHRNFLQSKLGNDYKQLPNNVDPSMTAQADGAVQRIGRAANKILTVDPAQSLTAWQSLSQATYDALSMMQFNSGYGGGGNRTAKKPGAATPEKDPIVDQAAQEIITASGITQPQLQQVQNIVGKLPDADTQDPRTKAYLKAIGFSTP
jgi:hypothetical protein